MRKQELIHLHALGEQLRHHVVRTGGSEAFAPYEDSDVYPTEVYRSKDDHRDAVLALFAGIGTALEPSAAESSRPDGPIPSSGE